MLHCIVKDVVPFMHGADLLRLCATHKSIDAATREVNNRGLSFIARACAVRNCGVDRRMRLALGEGRWRTPDEITFVNHQHVKSAPGLEGLGYGRDIATSANDAFAIQLYEIARDMRWAPNYNVLGTAASAEHCALFKFVLDDMSASAGLVPDQLNYAIITPEEFTATTELQNTIFRIALRYAIKIESVGIFKVLGSWSMHYPLISFTHMAKEGVRARCQMAFDFAILWDAQQRKLIGPFPFKIIKDFNFARLMRIAERNDDDDLREHIFQLFRKSDSYTWYNA
jgi:hypothetical protein